MKKIFLIAAAVFAVLVFSNQTEAKYRNGGHGFFYTSLAPHGMWIELDHGVVVWKPTIIRRNWAPYTQGQWIWTQDGWYWDSYEDFGYITYHYGRWFYDDYYGWIWLPDNEWAPAWVEWRYDDNYIGWAPLSPYAIFSINIGVHFTSDYYTPYNHWHFVKYRYFCDPYVNKYYAAPKYKHRIFSNTKYRNNYGYERGRVVNRGVDIKLVRERTGQNIREREIIRTSDAHEIERGSSRNNEKIRTFVASKEDLTRDAGNIEIKRSDRKTKLETTKVELSGRRTDRNSGSERNSSEELKDGGNNRTSTRETEGIRTSEDDAVKKSNENKRITEQKRSNKNTDADVRNPVKSSRDKVEVEKRNNERKPTIRNEEQRKKTPEVRVQPKIERRTETQRKETQAPVVRSNERERKVEVREEKKTEPTRTERKSQSTERKTDTNSRSKNRTR